MGFCSRKPWVLGACGLFGLVPYLLVEGFFRFRGACVSSGFYLITGGFFLWGFFL